MSKQKDSPRGEREKPVGRRRARFAAPAALAMALASGDVGAAAREPEEEIPGDAGEVREDDALRRLALHRDPEVRLRLAGWLPSALEWMSGVERTQIIAGWAVSDEPAMRLAIARALRYATPALGSYSAMEHLAGDPDPAVRLVIAEAAWLRRREAPSRLFPLLERLADDVDVTVREVARLALGDR